MEMAVQMDTTRLAPQERRLDYRLRYPEHLRPQLKLAGSTIPVLDISEWGIRFAAEQIQQVTCGDRVAGTVTFRRAPRQAIRGTVVRVGEHEVAAQLEHGLDFRVIAEEHDLVIRQSP